MGNLPPVVDFGIRREFSPSCPSMIFARISRLIEMVDPCDPSKLISKNNEVDACDLLIMALKVQLKKVQMFPGEEKDIKVGDSYHAKCALKLRNLETGVVENFLKGIMEYKD